MYDPNKTRKIGKFKPKGTIHADDLPYTNCISYMQLFRFNLKTYEEMEVKGYQVIDSNSNFDRHGLECKNSIMFS